MPPRWIPTRRASTEPTRPWRVSDGESPTPSSMHVDSSEQTPPPQRCRAEFDRPRSKVAFATTVPFHFCDPSPDSSSPPDVGLGSSE
eukprot:6041582-Pyramimonas_sp.AAC.1